MKRKATLTGLVTLGLLNGCGTTPDAQYWLGERGEKARFTALQFSSVPQQDATEYGGFERKRPSSESQARSGGRAITPFIRRPVNPSFDRKQSIVDIDNILSDGQEHTLSVLFDDKFKVRVKGDGNSLNRDMDISSISTAEGVSFLNSLKRTLSKRKVKSLAPGRLTQNKPEIELEKTERELESLAIGKDIPNEGSFASITLAEYSPEAAKSLVLELQQLPGVRSAQIEPKSLLV